jgi:hypothetical protein
VLLAGQVDDMARMQKVSALQLLGARLSVWYVRLTVGLVGVLFAWALIEDGIRDIDLKTIGIIIIVLLGLILYQVSRKK